jgi:hypothetical protein
MVKQFGNDEPDKPGLNAALAWRAGFGTAMTMRANSEGNPLTYYEGLGSVWFGSLEGHVQIQEWGAQ